MPKMIDVYGNYKGKITLKNNSSFPATFVVRQINRNIVAFLQGDNMNIELSSGYYVSNKGILTLISSTNGQIIKLTLAVSENKLIGAGMGVSNGTYYDIELTKQ